MTNFFFFPDLSPTTLPAGENTVGRAVPGDESFTVAVKISCL